MSSIAQTFFPNNVTNSTDINIPGLKVSQNRISLSTNDTERLWIDSQGKVGIGTSNPNQLLHLYQADSNEVQLKITNSSTTNGVLIGLTANEDFQIKSRDTGKNIYFGTNDATADMTIEAGGFVGIGTTNPSEMLHLNRADGASVQIRFTNGDSGSSLIGIDSSEDVVIKERATNNIKLFTADTERMRITNTGFVGIGTTSPTYRFDVQATSPTSFVRSRVYNTSAGSTGGAEYKIQTEIADWSLGVNNVTGSFYLYDAVAPGFRMVINSTGLVGIGTITPSKILHITSTTSGLLLPRMTTAQRDAIATPLAGELIYNTTTSKLNIYTTAWEQITSA